MSDLDYGYEITIETPGTSSPAATPTNQWQRKASGGVWVDITGATGATYTVASEDRACEIRLTQVFNGTAAYSNELSVTDQEVGDIIEDIGPALPGPAKWSGGVLAGNGKIYGVPNKTSEVLVIDPETDTVDTFAVFTSDTYRGGVLGPDGNIYCIPDKATNILEIDPNTNTATLWTGPEILPEETYVGGVLAPNGKIYAIPNLAPFVLEIDPVNKSWRYFGDYYFNPPNQASNHKWSGGVLAPNGKIYGIPDSHDQVLEIDPEKGTTSLFGDIVYRSYNYDKLGGGVLSPNGKIYAVPTRVDGTYEIDPVARTTTAVGWGGHDRAYKGGAILPDGRMTMAMYFSRRLETINTLENATAEQHTGNRSYYANSKYSGCVLAPNGSVYHIPYDDEKVLKTNFKIPKAIGSPGAEYWEVQGFPDNKLDPRAPYFNKF